MKEVIKDPITREEAKLLGLKVYYTGKPCIHGHITTRNIWNSTCDECNKRIKKKCQIKRQPERSIANKKQRKEDWPNAIIGETRRRAKGNNIPFNIDSEDILMPVLCPILGIPLLVGDDSPRDNHPSIDRLIPKLGYIKGNIIIVSYRANRIKNDATVEELGKIYKFYKKLLR